MANLKTLAKDTVIYGASSIIGRFLNYLLVPLYAYSLKTTGEYGIVTNIYAWTGLLLVILTYGMETSFFRFANKDDSDPKLVYSTILRTVSITSLLFVLLVILFISPLSKTLGYANNPSYLWVMSLTVSIDAIQSIAFAYLRYKGLALKFAMAKLSFIFLSIMLNLCFYIFIPYLNKQCPDIINFSTNNIGVAYIFYINLFCTCFVNVLLIKELKIITYGFDFQLLKKILRYGLPILLLGIVGILNQTIDKILFPKLYTQADSAKMLGIYGYVSKIAAIMLIITQAFRYAYEPFVFNKSKEKGNKESYAKAMKYYLIFTFMAFLFIHANMPIIKYLVNKESWQGLQVVPILMSAQIMMGIYFNLSFWYKLTDKTMWGALFSGIACVILISSNIIFVPKFGYLACAWSGLLAYTVAMLLSYIVGQKYYPIDYKLKDLAKYVIVLISSYFMINFSNSYMPQPYYIFVNNIIVVLFMCIFLYKETKIITKFFKFIRGKID